MKRFIYIFLEIIAVINIVFIFIWMMNRSIVKARVAIGFTDTQAGEINLASTTKATEKVLVSTSSDIIATSTPVLPKIFTLFKKINAESIHLYPSGKLSYLTYSPVNHKYTLFFDGKEIAKGNDDEQLSPDDIIFISGIPATKKYNSTTKKYTLIYNGQQLVTADSIPNFEEIDGKIAYVTNNSIESRCVISGDNKMLNVDSSCEVQKSGGDIIYDTAEKVTSVCKIFYAGKEVTLSNDLCGFKKIGGKIAYLTKSPSSSRISLNYNSKVLATSDSIIFFELKGKLVYITDDAVGQISDVFYDGNKILSSQDKIIDFKEIGGKKAYISVDRETKKQTLIYDGKEIVTVDKVLSFEDVAGKLVYVIKKIDKDTETLSYDGTDMAVADNIIRFEDIRGKFLYSTFDKILGRVTIFYDNIQMIAGMGLSEYSNVGSYSEIISSISYVGHDNSLNKDILFYKGEQVLVADKIGGFTRSVFSQTLPTYFYASNKKDGITTFSIYRVE